MKKSNIVEEEDNVNSNGYIDKQISIIVHDCIDDLKHYGVGYVFNDLQLSQIQDAITSVRSSITKEDNIYTIKVNKFEFRAALL